MQQVADQNQLKQDIKESPEISLETIKLVKQELRSYLEENGYSNVAVGYVALGGGLFELCVRENNDTSPLSDEQRQELKAMRDFKNIPVNFEIFENVGFL